MEGCELDGLSGLRFVGVVAEDNEGEAGADTPSDKSLRICSDFCFRSSRSASNSALLCSLASVVIF